MESSNQFLGTERISKLMQKYAIPCIISLLVGALYNIVDQIFIANASYLGSYGNAANTVVFPLTVVALAIAVMIGDGCCAFVSISLGQNEVPKAKRSVGNAVVMCLVSSIVLAALYLIFADTILAMFGGTVNAETYHHSQEYFFYITLGVPFYMFGQAMNPIIRADGNPRFAMVSTLAGAALNIILDPVFMFGLLPPGMEVTGAAVATMLSNVFSTLFLMICFFHLKNRTVLCLSLKGIFQSKKHILSVLVVGIPTALGTMLTCVSNTIVNRMAADYGDIPLAAAGIIKRVYQFPYSAAIGIGQGMLPLVAYNYASGNYSRMRQTIRCAMIFSMAFASVLITVYELLPSQIIRLFINERTEFPKSFLALWRLWQACTFC